MQLYSEQYRQLNEQLHQDNENYGKSGSKWSFVILKLAEQLRTKDILDYGCGKSSLSLHLPFSIKQYDPAIKKYEDKPNPADVVVCTDVLEHIEPECLDNVLQHLSVLTKQMGLFTASTKPAIKTLADGRNAHLIVKPGNWWLLKILNYFDVKEFKEDANECVFFVKPKSGG